MSRLRGFRATDLFRFNNVNLDVWTETFSISFYLSYLARWPELCAVQEAPNGKLMGYVIGKAEGTGDDWHGHVTAISVAPEYRRLQLASKMMRHLEQVSDTYHHAFFVDLYARSDNQIAIDMYERDGYSVYRQVQGYYAALEPNSIYGSENAYDMRKPCPRDTQRKSVRPNGRNILVPAKQVS